jgi:hypothetical protein
MIPRLFTGGNEMPIERKVSKDGLFVHTSAFGTVTSDELISHAQQMNKDNRIRPGFSELFDASRVTKIGITKEDIDQIVDMDGQNLEKNAGSKCAVVVAESEAFELGKYFEEISRQNYVKVIVFNSVATAKTWLGVHDTVEK